MISTPQGGTAYEESNRTIVLHRSGIYNTDLHSSNFYFVLQILFFFRYKTKSKKYISTLQNPDYFISAQGFLCEIHIYRHKLCKIYRQRTLPSHKGSLLSTVPLKRSSPYSWSCFALGNMGIYHLLFYNIRIKRTVRTTNLVRFHTHKTSEVT